MELRLFPLHTVLFPGMALPLNVFEPRYLQLIDECTRADEPFGVALIREGPEVGGFAVPFDVGTTARIERAEPGMLNAVSLLARGEQRFRITELHHDRPYLWVEAELIEEPPGEAARRATRAGARATPRVRTTPLAGPRRVRARPGFGAARGRRCARRRHLRDRRRRGGRAAAAPRDARPGRAPHARRRGVRGDPRSAAPPCRRSSGAAVERAGGPQLTRRTCALCPARYAIPVRAPAARREVWR